MARTAYIQTAFLAGETSPRLTARVDLDTYKFACKTMKNAIPFYHGGVKRRPGTLYHGAVRDSNDPVRLVPFVYSRTQSYLCVFNDAKIEFIKNGEFIESSPGTRYSISHTYANDELNEIRYAQFGNIVYFTHPNHPPRKLVRTSDTSWALTDISFIHRALTDQWYENSQIRFKLIGGSTTFLAGGVWTVVVTSGVAGTPSYSGTGNGSMIASALPGATDQTWTITCTYSDSSRQEWSVSGSVSGTLTHTFKSGNYPTAIAFYQQRLFLASTPAEPQTIWASAVADYTNLTIGSDDSDGFAVTLANSSNDLILHLAASPTNLLILSYANEFVLEANNGVYTPKSILARPQTSHGCNLTAPLRIGQDVIFCQRDGRRIRSVAYDIEKSANSARDLTIISEHITESGVVEMSFQQDPDFMVWACKEDGTFVSLTYLDEQKVVAWARHEMDGFVENVCTIPENNSDKTYLVVYREIDGVNKRYIESIDYTTESNTDCASFGSNVTPKTNWTGLGYLEGKTVAAIGDGSYLGTYTVTSGAITTSEAVEDIEVGLPFTTTIELLHPNPEVDGGTAQGRKLSVHEIILRLQNTIGCRVNNVDVPFREVGEPMDTPPEVFTGDKMVKALGWKANNNIKIEQVLPMPFTLLGCILKITVNE